MLENIDTGLLAELISLVLTVAISIMGPKFRKYYKKYKVLAEIIDDGEISSEEEKKIKKMIDKL